MNLLRPYQQRGAEFLAGKTRALLADEMRLGKTPQAIVAADAVMADDVLVLCPAIATGQWAREWQRWSGGYARVLDGKGDISCDDVVVASYDMARNRLDDLLARQWGVLIIDEAHFARNPEAQRTKMVYGKGGLMWRAKYVWALSGTPAVKHAAELWPMMRAFGQTKAHYDDFVRAYCYCAEDGRILGTRADKIEELREILSRFMLRRKRLEVAPEMSAIDFQFLHCTPDLSGMEALIKGQYDAALEQVKEVAALLKGVPIEAQPSLLEEYAAHMSALRMYTACAKTTTIVEEVSAAMTAELYTKTVVFGYHRVPLVLVRDGLRARGVKAELIAGWTPQKERERIINKFHNGGVDVVVANILAAGTAIDLSAANHGYFLELDWVPANNVQAANRLVSMQKAVPVTFDVAVWPGSIDEKVQGALVRRARELNQLL